MQTTKTISANPAFPIFLFAITVHITTSARARKAQTKVHIASRLFLLCANVEKGRLSYVVLPITGLTNHSLRTVLHRPVKRNAPQV
jgi:hypothetical protein